MGKIKVFIFFRTFLLDNHNNINNFASSFENHKIIDVF